MVKNTHAVRVPFLLVT